MTDKLPNERLSYLLQRASFLVTREFLETLKLKDISVPRWRMMVWLPENQPCTITDLTEELMLKQPSVTRLVEAARQEGIVQTVHDQRDRRRVNVTLTPAGTMLVEELKKSARAADQNIIGGLGAEQAADVKKNLQQIIQHYGP